MSARIICTLLALLVSTAQAAAQMSNDMCQRLCRQNEECILKCLGGDARAPSPPLRSEPHYTVRPFGWNDSRGGQIVAMGITETLYKFLFQSQTEADGYGLYSYLLVPNVSDHSAAFLTEVFKSVRLAMTVSAPSANTNILYIPSEKFDDPERISRSPSLESTRKFLLENYDYKRSSEILSRVCDKPTDQTKSICEGSLSEGPYILTYGKKVGDKSPLPPPLLIVDLTKINPRAFRQVILAYEAQVKRDDFSDNAKLKTFRLELLNILMTMSDAIEPSTTAVSSIVRFATAEMESKAK